MIDHCWTKETLTPDASDVRRQGVPIGPPECEFRILHWKKLVRCVTTSITSSLRRGNLLPGGWDPCWDHRSEKEALLLTPDSGLHALLVCFSGLGC